MSAEEKVVVRFTREQLNMLILAVKDVNDYHRANGDPDFDEYREDTIGGNRVLISILEEAERG